MSKSSYYSKPALVVLSLEELDSIDFAMTQLIALEKLTILPERDEHIERIGKMLRRAVESDNRAFFGLKNLLFTMEDK